MLSVGTESRVADLKAKDRMEGIGRPRPSKLDADSNSNLGLSCRIGIPETKACITGSKMSGIEENSLQPPRPYTIIVPQVLPMVEIKVVLKASSEKRKRTQVFPTPESPIRSSLKSRSYVFFAIGRSGSGSRRRRPQGIGPSHYSQLLTRAFLGRRTGEAWEKGGLERARETYERPRRGSPDGGGVRASEGGDGGSAASPRRSSRFRGVGRDKMASPPPSELLGRDAPTGELASSAV